MSVSLNANDTIIRSDLKDRTSNVFRAKTDLADVADAANSAWANVEMKEEDEKSLSEEEFSNDDDDSANGDEEDEKYDNDEGEPKNGKRISVNGDTQKCSALTQPLNSLSPRDTTSARSVIEWDDNDNNDTGFSQDPRSFLSRIFWNETDVRFYNQTDREVMFVIADEEFTLKRTSKVSTGASINDDDDNDDFSTSNSLSGVIPISANLKGSQSQTATQSALKTRCMPLAPHSDSSQYFQEERLTYVTALTKDIDGEDIPWSRVHYENKVINCKRTKSLKFFNKHLKVMAYRITQPPQSSQSQIVSPITSSSICDLKQVTSSSSNHITRGKAQKRLSITEKHDSMKRTKDGCFK